MIFRYSESDGLDVFKGIRHRAVIRMALGLPSRVLPKTEFSENSTDVFGSVAAKVWYTAEDVISGVEIYYPEAEFFIFGKQVLGGTVSDLELIVKGAGAGLTYEKDGSGVNIKEDTVRFYAPDVGVMMGQAKIEAVYIEIPSV